MRYDKYETVWDYEMIGNGLVTVYTLHSTQYRV